MGTLLSGSLRSKTVWFNVLSLLAIVFASEPMQQFVAAETLLMLQAAVNLILRFVTTQAVTSKAPV
jgi:hypothetical protein